MMPVLTNSITSSWELKININEFDIHEQSLIVNGETHIGVVIIQLVEKLNHLRNDWSDFSLWWPSKNMWLKKTKMTLDQYGVQADAVLYFTRTHKFIRLQLPDLQIIDLNVDFSINLFNLVKQVCKEVGIRHSEELSLLKLVNQLNKKSNNKNKDENKNNTKSEVESSNLIENNLKSNKENGSISSGTSTLNNSSSNNSKSKYSNREKSLSLSIENGNESLHSDSTSIEQIHLSLSPIINTQDYLKKNQIKFKNLFDKTRLNIRWLESSKSLMEQNINENDLVQLKFKYYAFLDLNTKLDLVRINQIYEQAKWSILSEEIDCTEQELINFAALQLQIQLQTKSIYSKTQSDYQSINKLITNRHLSIEDASLMKQSSILFSSNNKNDLIDDEDDVDTALSKLEKSLDIVDSTSGLNSTNLDQKSTNALNKTTVQNQLCETIDLIKPQKYTFNKTRPFYFILDDSHYLSYFKSEQDSAGKPIDKINLKSCEVVPDVNLSSRKFGINIKIPSADGMNEICLRFKTEESYANWMSGIKLASKSKSITDPSYLNEVNSILNLLNIQQSKNFKSSSSNSFLNSVNSNNTQSSISGLKHKNTSLGLSYQSINSENDSAEVQATNLLPSRILKKYKLKQLNDRILEAYSTISDLDIHESKWRYIKEWQALPSYGILYFAVKIQRSRFREELIGITSNRLMRTSPEGETLKSWRMTSMKSWNVNWDIKQFEIIFDEEQLVFVCLNCDAKILHEYIGGYIYLSLRQSSKSECSTSASTSNVNEEMFFKLTEKR